MAIAVDVPKDLSGIKTKVALNLTKRQLICFGSAAVTGVPLYLLTKETIGTEAAAMLMITVMLPFFIFAMYEKDGMHAEEILKLIIRQKYLVPGIRRYRSENLFIRLEEEDRIRREVISLEAKADKYRKNRAKKKRRVRKNKRP